jgi:drug/metabolite transporter (DMT)-like permease
MVAVTGVGLVLLAALATAIQVVCIRVGTAEGRSSDALVIVLFTNVCIIVPLALFSAYPNYGLTPVALASFGAAGLVGTMLGRAFYYAGIKRVGASRAEPVKGTMPLFATGVAVLVLGEALSAGRLFGIALVVLGVAVLSRELAADTEVTADPSDLLVPLAGAFFYAVEPTFAKFGLAEGTPVFVGLGIKTLVATGAFLAYLGWRGALPTGGAFGDGRLRWYLAAGVANTGFLLAYYGALAVAPVVLIVPVMQTSPLFVLVLSYLFLSRLERVTPRLVVAATIVVFGAVIVTVAG